VIEVYILLGCGTMWLGDGCPRFKTVLWSRNTGYHSPGDCPPPSRKMDTSSTAL